MLSLTKYISRSSEAIENTEMAPRTCHGCHGPLNSGHQDYPSGWQRCPLPHWDGCPGGVLGGKAANGSEWKACPEGYEPGARSGTCQGDLKDSELEGSETEGEDNKMGDNRRESGNESYLGDHDENTDDEANELKNLEAANILLKRQLEERERVAKSEHARKLAMLKEENIILTQAMGGDIGGGRPKDLSSKTSASSRLKSKKKKSKTSVMVQEHATRNQLRSSEYRPEDASFYTGINIKGIRKIPALSSEVETLVEKVQQSAPSLDRRPSFVQLRPSPALARAESRNVEDVMVEHEYVYQRLEDGALKKVRVINTPVKANVYSEKSGTCGTLRRHESPVYRHEEDDDPETSSDEECDEEPAHGYRFKWRRDENGEKYFVEEKLVCKSNLHPGMVYRYVKDPATGRSYKRLVWKSDPKKELVPEWVVDPDTGNQVKMLVPKPVNSGKIEENHVSVKADSRNFVTPDSNHTRVFRAKTQSSHLQEEKQGKMPTIIQYARDCPVSWTSKVTSDKLNLGLWCWAYVAELLASRTGQAPPLQQGELEARLQHYLNVLEIALQPGNAAEFDNQSWRVARLYAEKVQQKLERGDSWLGFGAKYGSDSHPHELMAAEKELAFKPKKKDDEKKPKDEKKKTCTTWNSSVVEGKCEYEVQNEGKICNRRHECSWCKDKGKTSLRHQRSFCRLRISAEEQ